MTEPNGNLTLDELYAAANEMCQRHWGVEYTGTIVLKNRRWRNTNGHFAYMPSDPSFQQIRMCKSRNASQSREFVLGTLLHELVHWRLHAQDIPARDTSDTFIAECLRVGAPISGTIAAQNALKRYIAIQGYEERTGRKYGEEALYLTEKKPRAPRKKAEPKPKINTLDWRNLPYEKWNTRTFTKYFADMNREHYGSETYLPFRNWSVEQGMVKRAITQHGAEILRAACDEAFRTYRPTREYPLLTAGFAISYRINAIIPGLLAQKADDERRAAELQAEGDTDYGALGAML